MDVYHYPDSFCRSTEYQYVSDFEGLWTLIGSNPRSSDPLWSPWMSLNARVTTRVTPTAVPALTGVWYNDGMETKDQIDVYAKSIDALYKKTVILLAIAGGFGAYAIKFLSNGNWTGFVFAAVFLLVSVAIFITYARLNVLVNKLERMTHE